MGGGSTLELGGRDGEREEWRLAVDWFLRKEAIGDGMSLS